MTEDNGVAIILSIITLIGILGGALFTNWDKIFPKKNEIKAEYFGYGPTGFFETELRTYINVSGARALLENNLEQILQVQKVQAIRNHPLDAEKIDIYFNTVQEESVTVDEVIKALLPVYKNYFSIEELQELNRFYSTETMQNMIKKNLLLAVEAAPIQAKIIEKYQARLSNALENKLIDHEVN